MESNTCRHPQVDPQLHLSLWRLFFQVQTIGLKNWSPLNGPVKMLPGYIALDLGCRIEKPSVSLDVQHGTEVPGASSSANSAQIELPKQTPLTSATKSQQNKQRSRAKATSNSSWSLVRDTCVIKKSSNWPRWNCCQWHPNPGTSVHAVRHLHWQCSTAPRCLVQVPPQTLPKLSCAKTNSPDIGHP